MNRPKLLSDRRVLPRASALGWRLAAPERLVLDEAFIDHVSRLGQRVPAAVYAAVAEFVNHGAPAGGLLVADVPVGDPPATPPTPTSATTKDAVSETALLTIARLLGQPVGYRPEHGGDLIQNVVPTRAATARQVSTSSAVELMFHTEAAFHPYRPRYLLLLCLRGDPAAATTIASIVECIDQLSPASRATLFEPRFRTAIDESYLHGRPNQLGAPVPVLSGDPRRPTMVFDADLMVGTDHVAEDALAELGRVLAANQRHIVLQPGELLIVDNNTAVHGRTPFTPRFDGSDRWLQRSFVVADLSPSAGDRDGRVITTQFGI